MKRFSVIVLILSFFVTTASPHRGLAGDPAKKSDDPSIAIKDNDKDKPEKKDKDGDGYKECKKEKKDHHEKDKKPCDCDDANPAIHPGAAEICENYGIDNDCNENAFEPAEDSDHDGAPDCLDQCASDPLKNLPGLCGCGISDANFVAWYADADGDGFGDSNHETQACSQPQGSVGNNQDCDDANMPVHPGAAETCDALDNNCDGNIDEGIPGCVNGRLEDLPPDPSQVAPKVDQTIATNFHDATTFLYTGNDPIQIGVEAGAIDDLKAAVIRGRVVTREGAPFPGVAISISGHPEYGSTKSRADGLFDLAVNGGGGDVVVRYAREGHLAVERRVAAEALDYAWVKDVVMTPLDSNATAIDLAAPGGVQVAQGSEITDGDGTRKAVVLFPQGTSAMMALPDGSVEVLGNMTVRITEFTVGQAGPSAMPGELPPTSAYTYAADFTIDEAMAAGAKRVTFDRPVIFYLENFLNFPTGFPVPLGYYDTDKSSWIASDNGIVIKILEVVDGRASIALDEGNAPATAEALANLSVTDAELTTLASRYSVGQTLWRVPIPHFTAWDCNMSIGPPPDAVFASTSGIIETPNELMSEPTLMCGSIIGCESQTLGETIGITGSDFDFYYNSARAGGRKSIYKLKIPLSSDDVPQSLKRIDFEIDVAGQKIAETFDPTPNQRYDFVWDGKDAYGRILQGVQPVTVRISYVYDTVYQGTLRFGYGSNGTITMTPARDNIALISEWHDFIGGWRNTPAGIGGLSLGIQHAYDPAGKTLYFGDGSQRTTTKRNDIIRSIAGGGQGYPENGGKATDVMLSPSFVAAGPDGDIYTGSPFYQMVFRIDTEGNFTKFAGNPSKFIGNYERGFGGDGGLATLAHLNFPAGITADGSGNLYVADKGNNRIRKVDANGIITTIAGHSTVPFCGGGCSTGYDGDGGLATAALFDWPTDVAVDREGNIYIVDQTRDPNVTRPVIRKIGNDGIVTTIAGSAAGNLDYGFDGVHPSRQVTLCRPTGMALDIAGNIFIAEPPCARIRKITPEGQIMVVAGGGDDAVGENIPAKQAKLNGPIEVVVDDEGSLLIGENGGYRIRKVGGDGRIVTIAGTGQPGLIGDGGPAIDANMGINGICADQKGAVYVADNGAARLRKITPMFPGVAHEEMMITSEDGAEIYHFDRFGRHLETKDALTGGILYTFDYDGEGLLSAVTDAGGKVTSIERDANGAPTAIVAPFGIRTALALDDNGYLKSATDPAGGITSLEYFPGGLLKKFTDPNSHASAFAYDDLGFLTLDTDAAGGFKSLSKATDDAGYTVTVSTALGRSDVYRVEQKPTGAIRRVATDPAGFSTETNITAGGDKTITYADGTVISQDMGPDPRFGMQSPIINSRTTTTPGGLISKMTTTKSVTLANPEDNLSLTGETDQTTINGRTYRSVYTAQGGIWTTTSPEGRVTHTTIDNVGRITENDAAGIDATSFSYDNKGRLSIIAQGARSSIFTYKPTGFLGTITDAANRVTAFDYDGAGRVSTQTLPDGRAIGYIYDAAGNLTSVTPPGRLAHTFDFSPVNLATLYDPPNIGIAEDRTIYTYDLDRSLKHVTRPDGQGIDFNYDAAGRLGSITLPGGEITYGYDPATGNLALVTADNESIGYTYDGSLPLSTTWQGTVSGTVSRTYDNNFHVTQTKVNGGNAVAYSYDNDGLITGAGNFVVARDPTNGLISGTTLANVATSPTYNAYGETSTVAASYAGNAIYSATLTRDLLGRITDKAETIGGQQKGYVYTYYTGGMLKSATVDGQTTTYVYDDNGNRTGMSLRGEAEVIPVASYDAQDRLISYRDNTYTYTDNGELKTKTNADGVTSYTYDVLGNLRAVTLPDGTNIEYLIDGQNRRIGKKVNGALVKGWLYANQLNPIAELDGNGAVVSTFIYATKANIPDYMVQGGVAYRIVSDHLGSPRLIVNAATGEVTQRIDYDEFGIVINDTNPAFQPFAFAGGLYDPQTKLVRFGARDYDAETGRWTSKDPIRFKGGDTNIYGYVFEDPINRTDILGLSEADVASIQEQFYSTVNIMTTMDIRHPNPYWNNFSSFWNMGTGGRLGSSYLGCGGQSFAVKHILSQGVYDDVWSFSDVSLYGGIHHVVQATSSNPLDPVIILDPWANSIAVDSKR